MIVLLTDFGGQDPYVGQVKAVLDSYAPGQTVIDLLHDVPDFNAHAGAHLLAALSGDFPIGAVFLCVVDPGVGSPRDAVVVEADGRWFVGPDNGLLSIVAGRAETARFWRIVWRPDRLSSTFHGRDLFAPIAAAIASGVFPDARLAPVESLHVVFDLGDLPRVIYIDHYGNGWTGMRSGLLELDSVLEVSGLLLRNRQAFHEAGRGELFWFVNSVGLIEIAANRTSAAEKLSLAIGNPVRIVKAPATRH